ncbi:MAG: oligosaccharyl transferase, archaeosortase A system-associated [Dehalococcoidia bacterium]
MSEQSPGQRRRLPPAAIAAIILAALCGLSLYIRIHLGYDQIFVNDWILFRETDAYYYIRNIENMVHNFPRFNAFDPYMLYPGGGGGLARPFFAWLVAGAALLIGGGAPTEHTIQVVGAYMPAILGALTLIPVYFIGKELFNRWAGIISAALLAILPGEFMNRSLLGFTDHHVAETLLSTVAVLFLIMAINRAREREISFSHVLARDWSTITRPLVYALLAGIFLGFYLLSWVGGLLFIFVIFAYLLVQFLVDHLRRRSTDYLCIIGTPVFLVAFLMLLPVLGAGGRETAYRVSMLVAILVPLALSLISRLMAGRGLKPAYYPLALVVLAGVGLAAFHAINPDLFRSMRGLFGIFAPVGPGLTVLEMQPLTATIAWGNFNTSFFIAFISLAVVVYLAVRERSAPRTLFLVWSIIMLAAVLGQRRFGYYYAVNAALLTGYFSWKILDLAGLGKLLAKSREAVSAVKEFKKRKRTTGKARPKRFMQPRGVWVRVIVAGIVIFFLVFFPSIGLWREVPSRSVRIGEEWLYVGYTRYIAERPPIIERGWYTSLVWLRDNSPEPFPDPDFYYQLYPSRAEFEYPETAYGVMSWWDYGYFIMQIARRIPNANPGQAGAIQAGQFFTSQNETAANAIADDRSSKYVVIDHTMPTGKFYAMVEWAGLSRDEFFEVYYQRTEDGGVTSITLYHPAYYRSAAVRLYNFDGQAVVPQESIVISYEEITTPEAMRYKEITDVWRFPTYEEAEAFMAAQESGNYRIGNPDPFSSPVPLEELNSYELVHSSQATRTLAGQTFPAVKIFEYLGPEWS